jgi:hypothetical protein
MHLIFFLLAVGKHHPSGKLGTMDDDDLADMGKWSGDAGLFADALRTSGWLQIGEGGYWVVGWEEYGGRVYAARETHRKEKLQAINKRWHLDGKHKNAPVEDCPLCVNATESAPTIQNDTEGIQNDTPVSSVDTKHTEYEYEGEYEVEVNKNKHGPTCANSTALTIVPSAPVEQISPDRGVDQVCKHYLSRYPRRVAQTKNQTTRRKIKARLQDGYTPEQLCKAIDGNASRAFNREGGFHDLELCVRDAKHVDLYLAELEQEPRAGPPSGYVTKKGREVQASYLHGLNDPDIFPDGPPKDFASGTS